MERRGGGFAGLQGGGQVHPAGHRSSLTGAHYSDRRGVGLLMLPLEIVCWLIWKFSQSSPLFHRP